jgi:DNA-binding GntR family transcriptional regulator
MSREASSDSTRDRVEDVRSELRKRILNWDYGPGTRLLEKDLSDEFGVSRALLREALSQLEAAGLVRKVRNKGYSVSQPNMSEIRELYDLRKALELYAAEQLCSGEICEDVIQRLYAIWDEPLQNGEDPAQALSDRDRRFHEAIAEAYGNETLLARLREINDRITILRQIDFAREEAVASVRAHHHEIVRAFERGDVSAAKQALRENIEHAEAQVETALKEMLLRAFHSQAGAE